jgi:hypothetical protein
MAGKPALYVVRDGRGAVATCSPKEARSTSRSITSSKFARDLLAPRARTECLTHIVTE